MRPTDRHINPLRALPRRVCMRIYIYIYIYIYIVYIGLRAGYLPAHCWSAQVLPRVAAWHLCPTAFQALAHDSRRVAQCWPGNVNCHLASLRESWFFKKPAYAWFWKTWMCTCPIHLKKYTRSTTNVENTPNTLLLDPTATAPWGIG